MTQIERLVDLMARLRGPGGCPWDLEQTHDSLKPYVLEEAYEVVEAIDASAEGDDTPLKDELGDLLLQVVFHARIAEEEDRFDFEAVAEIINEKLVRRHPHVFGDVEVDGSDEVLRNWDAIKQQEKADRGESNSASALDGVPLALPALMRAQKVQKKAAKTGFEWSGLTEISAKVREELDELQEAAEAGDEEAVEEELGDLLFAAVALGRYLDIGSEEALRKAVVKFTKRFQAMESELAEEGRSLEDTPVDEMETIWNRLRKHNTSQ